MTPLRPENHSQLPDSPHQQRLEDWTQQLCRSQSDMRAPESLHTSVMTRLERRARQWWRRPATHWPWWANATMLVLCALSAWLLVFDLPMPNDWLSALLNTAQVLHDLLWLIVDRMPVAWSLAAGGCVLAIGTGVAGLQRLALR